MVVHDYSQYYSPRLQDPDDITSGTPRLHVFPISCSWHRAGCVGPVTLHMREYYKENLTQNYNQNFINVSHPNIEFRIIKNYLMSNNSRKTPTPAPARRPGAQDKRAKSARNDISILRYDKSSPSSFAKFYKDLEVVAGKEYGSLFTSTKTGSYPRPPYSRALHRRQRESKGTCRRRGRSRKD